MEGEIDTIFTFAALRKDFYNYLEGSYASTTDKNGNRWTQDFFEVTLDSESDSYAYVKGFQMWQENGCHFPLIIEKADKPKYAIYGVASTWSPEIFPQAIKKFNDVLKCDENHHQRKITTVFQDRNCTIPMGKAYIYYQEVTHEKLGDSMPCGGPRFTKEKEIDFFKWSCWKGKRF